MDLYNVNRYIHLFERASVNQDEEYVQLARSIMEIFDKYKEGTCRFKTVKSN